MKSSLVSVVWAVMCVWGAGFVTGCGGGGSSSGGGGNNNLPPAISSFSANLATIEAGSSVSLAASFTGGTGAITPGNLSVTSGTPVSVSPTTTTTYTLTVTGTGGTASSSTAVTVDPVPTISSFTVTPPPVRSGQQVQFAAVFSNGTGAIAGPGNSSTPVTSGTQVSIAVPMVSTLTTETYTLTVVSPVGPVNATQTVSVAVNPAVISNFSAAPAQIESGSSVQIAGQFSGGAGAITGPGISGTGTAVTSGVAITVTPPAVTTETADTYTLTVTPADGSLAATLSVSVTVFPLPAISSFAASPASITPGKSATLTATFGNGTGTVTAPGGFSSPIASGGTGINVTPSATTTYTLTVSPPAGCQTCASVTQTVTVSVGTAAITSFTASPSEIGSGSSATLTGYFSGGTGVITPGADGSTGSMNVTSGQLVSVNPATTTTFTLTVTPSGGGGAQTAQATVTVYSIGSFTASASTIVAGGNTQLTADFVNGTGVITPGPINVTSGMPVTVSPTQTTTYTLTVTPSQGSGSPITQTTTVDVQTAITVNPNPSSQAPEVTDRILGMNLATWYDVAANASAINAAFGQAGVKAIRWPGGSWSDAYHWGQGGAQPSMCPAGNNGSSWGGWDTFAQFMTAITEAGSYDLALTANYGSNAACNGGGDPAEAAAWAAQAVSDGYPASHITVGNEEYGSWEFDLHTAKNNPTTYASAVTGAAGYYSLIKAQSPNTLVGVVVDAGTTQAGWDSTVLANAKGSYDFVEYHYYPQLAGSESDTTLVQQAAQTFTQNVTTLQSELTKAGEPNTPIYVGEVGSVNTEPGKQSWSITQGLYAGQILGEAMNDGIARLTWWIGFGNCNGDNGNMSASLYGWQNFGAYNVFADGSGDTGGTDNSACNYGGNIGAMSPTAQAFNLFQNVAVSGEKVLTATVLGDTANVRAYAASHSGGEAIVLFNLNESASATVQLAVSGVGSSNDVKVITYDKEIYDYTNPSCQLDPACSYDPSHNYSTAQWAPPITTDEGQQNLPLMLTLAPWSMNVVLVR